MKTVHLLDRSHRIVPCNCGNSFYFQICPNNQHLYLKNAATHIAHSYRIWKREKWVFKLVNPWIITDEKRGTLPWLRDCGLIQRYFLGLLVVSEHQQFIPNHWKKVHKCLGLSRLSSIKQCKQKVHGTMNNWFEQFGTIRSFGSPSSPDRLALSNPVSELEGKSLSAFLRHLIHKCGM